jgi:hypothetical protein
MPTELDVALKKAADYLNGELEKQAQNPLEGFIDAIPDEAKSALRNALIGGLLGAGGGAYAGGEGNRLRGALSGAGLGAATGGLGTLGMQMLGGQLQLPGERGGPESIIGRTAGGITGMAASHPGTALGGLLGGIGAWRMGPKSQEILEYLRKIAPKDPEAAGALKALDVDLQRPSMEYISEAMRKAREPLTYSGPNVRQQVRKLVSGKSTGKIAKLKAILSEALIGSAQKGTTGLRGTLGAKGTQLAGAGKELASAARINRILQALPETLKRSRAPWLLLPGGIAGGFLVDKYLKGEY